jgi:hypothetical protein
MNQLFCFIKVQMGDGSTQECGRPTGKLKELCCPDHWKLVPRKLKQALIEAEKYGRHSRMTRAAELERERRVMVAASDIVVFLGALKVQLPPVKKLELSGQLQMSGPLGELVKVDSGPTVSKESKLIIPGR